MQDLMIDIETLGTAANAPVLSVGACYFNRDTGEIGDTFHAKIAPEDALRYGKMNGATFKWWMGQSDDARSKVVAGTKSAELVYRKFAEFCAKHGINVRPWGNGSSFDITILEVQFGRVLGETPPWKFWNVRDCRTVKDLANSAGFSYTGTLTGTAHSALDDAVFQAKWVSYYWKHLLGKTDNMDDLLGDS